MGTPLNYDRRLAALEREIAQLRTVAAGPRRRDPQGAYRRQMRLAMTMDDGSGYPASPADTLPIVFQNGTFTATAGSHTPSYTDRSADPQAVAHSLIGWVPEGLHMFVVFHDERWWIPFQPPLLGKTDALHAIDDDGVVSIWTGTPGSESDTGKNVTAWNVFGEVAAGRFVWVQNNGYGWYLTSARCVA